MKIEMRDMGLRYRKGRPVYKTKIILDGKVHYNEVDRLLVDRYGGMVRQREDEKRIAKLKSAQERVTG